MPPAPSPFQRARLAGVLALVAWLAGCGVIGPSKQSVETFCTEVVPVISEWRADALKPFGTDEFNGRIGSADQQRMFVVFSKLGGLASFQAPTMTGYTTSTGKGTFVTVEVNAKFARGPAVIRMVLRSSGGDLKLNALNIRSPVFSDPSARPSTVQQI